MGTVSGCPAKLEKHKAAKYWATGEEAAGQVKRVARAWWARGGGSGRRDGRELRLKKGIRSRRITIKDSGCWKRSGEPSSLWGQRSQRCHAPVRTVTMAAIED